MKFIESEPLKKSFIPFSMTFEFETVEEARLMWHVLAHANLEKLFIADKDFIIYGNIECAFNGYDLEARKFIESKIGDHITW